MFKFVNMFIDIRLMCNHSRLNLLIYDIELYLMFAYSLILFFLNFFLFVRSVMNACIL